jgi:uncharacterized protein (DUF1697 family)
VPTYVALLRGINVGGRNKVAMSELRDVVTSLGHRGHDLHPERQHRVRHQEDQHKHAGSRLGTRHRKAFGVRPRVVVLSRDELAAVIAANPYPDEPNPRPCTRSSWPTHWNGMWPTDCGGRGPGSEKGGRDEVRLIGRTLYLHTPDGFGRSELAALLLRSDGKSIGASATARNWATVTKLLDLCG